MFSYFLGSRSRKLSDFQARVNPFFCKSKLNPTACNILQVFLAEMKR